MRPLRKMDMGQEDLVGHTGQLERGEQQAVRVKAVDGSHARDLQNRLVDAYQSEPEQKLPMRQRVAIVVGSTVALWGMIAGTIYLSI